MGGNLQAQKEHQLYTGDRRDKSQPSTEKNKRVGREGCPEEEKQQPQEVFVRGEGFFREGGSMGKWRGKLGARGGDGDNSGGGGSTRECKEALNEGGF